VAHGHATDGVANVYVPDLCLGVRGRARRRTSPCALPVLERACAHNGAARDIKVLLSADGLDAGRAVDELLAFTGDTRNAPSCSPPASTDADERALCASCAGRVRSRRDNTRDNIDPFHRVQYVQKPHDLPDLDAAQSIHTTRTWLRALWTEWSVRFESSRAHWESPASRGFSWPRASKGLRIELLDTIRSETLAAFEQSRNDQPAAP
jgi:hypothetical protein